MQTIETLACELDELKATLTTAEHSGAGDGLQPIGPFGNCDAYVARVREVEDALARSVPANDVEARLLARFVAERSKVIAADFAEPAGIGPIVADLAIAAQNLAAYLGATAR